MLPLLKHRLTRRVLFTLVFELVALNAVILAVIHARSAWWGTPPPGQKVWIFAGICTVLIQFGFWSFGLYSKQVIYSGRRVFQSLVAACAVLSGALFLLCYFFSLGGDALFSPTLRFFPVLIGALFLVVVAAERFSVLRLFESDTDFGHILVVGTGPATEELIDEARRHHGESIRLIGVIGEKDSVGQRISGCEILGTLRDLPELVRERKIKTVVLAVPYDYPELPLDFLLECKMTGLRVCDATSFYETVSQKILLEKLEPFSVLYPEGYTMTRLRWATKEVLERFIALCLLTLLGIPLAVIWALLRLSTRSSAIYRQERVGKGGHAFTLYKFRSMVMDAEKETGAKFADPNDSRVTWIGRWLRRTRFDELPQLINVLKGDMAFVGPRPERPEFVAKLRADVPFYHHRHFVKPGLTGWAQVSFSYGRNLDDSREKLRFDLYYVKNMSLFFDVIIMLSTIRAVIRGTGI